MSSGWSQEAHDARLANGDSTLDRWNVESVIARIEEYPEIIDAALAARVASAAADAWDEGAWATAERWDTAPARDNPHRAALSVPTEAEGTS